MTLQEMQDLMDNLPPYSELTLASPVPALMMILRQEKFKWSVFHNDQREKKELPNGKIVMTVSKTGWVIV